MITFHSFADPVAVLRADCVGEGALGISISNRTQLPVVETCPADVENNAGIQVWDKVPPVGPLVRLTISCSLQTDPDASIPV